MKNPKKKIGTAAWIVFLVGFFAFLYVFNTTLDYQKPGDYQDGIVYEKGPGHRGGERGHGPRSGL